MLIVLRPHAGGGIGNYLFRLCHAIMYAQIRQAALVVPRPVAFRTMNERTIVLDYSEPGGTYDPDRIEVLGPFIHGNEATRLLSFAYRYHCMREEIAPLFQEDAPCELLDDDTLAIHIRSGDIFQPDGSNPKYGQPPLSWYQLLIERCGYRNVVVVSQTRFPFGGPNPVVAEIAARWPHVRFTSGDIETDFHTLRRARHLALSGGTFSVAAAMLSDRLRRLHVARYDRPADPNFTNIFPSGVDLGFDRCDYDIHAYEGMRDWANRPEQIDLMLRHSVDDIEVRETKTERVG